MGTHYNSAKKFYDIARKNLTSVSSLVKYSLESTGAAYNQELFYTEFDVLLQYSLLELALYDGDLDLEELSIISEITEYGDLMDYFSCYTDEPISWNDLFESRALLIKQVLNAFHDRMVDIAADFCGTYAIVAATFEEYLDVLFDAVKEIFAAVILADGEYDAGEKDKIGDNFFWMHVIEGIKSQMSNYNEDDDDYDDDEDYDDDQEWN